MTIAAEYEQALELIRRLDRPTQARLIAQVVQELATQPAPVLPQVADPRAALAALRAHFAALGPTMPSAAEQLEHDRQQRAAMLEGGLRDADVHG